MKILLDECIDRRLKKHLSKFDVFTVSQMGFKGLKNGRLLEMASKERFDILLTIDKNIKSQQNIKKYNISLVIFDVQRANVDALLELVPQFEAKAKTFRKYEFYILKN